MRLRNVPVPNDKNANYPRVLRTRFAGLSPAKYDAFAPRTKTVHRKDP